MSKKRNRSQRAKVQKKTLQEYQITSRTTFSTVHLLSPAQVLDIQAAANRAQNDAINRWMSVYLNAGEPLQELDRSVYVDNVGEPRGNC